MDITAFSDKLGISSAELIELLTSIGDKKLSLLELIQQTGLSKETVKKFRTSLQPFLVPSVNFFMLNEKGKELLKTAEKKPLAFTAEDEAAIRNVLKTYASKRPVPERSYDQFYSTPDTQVRRIKHLIENNDLANAQVLILGDDDITSVCLAVCGIAKRIVVAEIDQRQIDFINLIARNEKLKIETYLCDLKSGLLPELTQKFDLVFTDPPYTPNGFSLFLQRELEALKDSRGTCYICYGTSERSAERLLPVQKAINDFNLVITFTSKNFNKYTGAESIGSSSNLYVLKPTQSTKIVKKPDLNRIYTYE